jgi:hypothetical protein
MTAAENKLDPELLQARWVLGGLNPEQMVSQAILALEMGFDGTALRQLAGLTPSEQRDLGRLPERAFDEMGLKSCDRDQAVALLVARQASLTTRPICALVQAFPDFFMRWRKHLADWKGEPAGSYIDMAEFVHFVVEDLYETERFDEIARAFQFLERLLVDGDQETRDLVGLGFFETLQNFASWRPYGNMVFEQYLGPMSKQCWREIQRQWAGKSSLMDVIRSERRSE